MLLTEIKKDRMIAMKNGKQPIVYNTLTTLLSEIQRLEKVDQENDAKVQGVIQKMIKGLDEMYAIQTDIDTKMHIAQEAKALQCYLPKQLTEDELTKLIKKAIEDSGAETPRDMGKVMTILKNNFEGRYDGKEASGIVRSLLS